MRNMITREIGSGLCMGMKWGYAISYCLNNPDCKIEKVYKWANPHALLDDKKVFSHYSLIAFTRRIHRKRIPKSLNDYISNRLENTKSNDGILFGISPKDYWERKDTISGAKNG